MLKLLIGKKKIEKCSTFYNMTFKKKLYKHFRTKIWDTYDPRIRLDLFCVFDLFQENVKELSKLCCISSNIF